MNVRSLLIALSLALFAHATLALPLFSGSASDPAGDTASACCDLVFASATVDDANNLLLSARFAPGYDAALARVQFDLDLDQDATTGHPGVAASGTIDNTLLGVDFLVRAGGGSTTADALEFVSFNNFALVGTGATTFLADGFDVLVSMALVGDDGLMNVKLTSSQCVTANAGQACANLGITDILTDEGLAPISTTAVPEPTALALVALGLLGVGASGRRGASSSA